MPQAWPDGPDPAQLYALRVASFGSAEAMAEWDREVARRQAATQAAEADSYMQKLADARHETEDLQRAAAALRRAGSPGLVERVAEVRTERRRWLRPAVIEVARRGLPSAWPVGRHAIAFRQADNYAHAKNGEDPPFTSATTELGVLADGELVRWDGRAGFFRLIAGKVRPSPAQALTALCLHLGIEVADD